jgi:hypothetical protein
LVTPPNSTSDGNGVIAVPAGAVRVFELDSELIDHLEGSKANAARQVIADTWRLRKGRWEPDGNPTVGPLDYGLLILDGLVLCRCTVGKRVSAELLGVGDILNPVQSAAAPHASVESELSWHVLEPARVALIDADLMARVAMFRGIAAKLHARSLWRVRSFAFRLAIAQLPQLTTRVQLLLWHLADRWGYRRADDVVIPFRISQRVIAECVSAQRTSVGHALKVLADQNLVQTTAEAPWTLHGAPPPDC